VLHLSLQSEVSCLKYSMPYYVAAFAAFTACSASADESPSQWSLGLGVISKCAFADGERGTCAASR
jgi:hypothetical protein